MKEGQEGELPRDAAGAAEGRESGVIRPDSGGKYVDLRRYLACLEHSLEAGTQWAVFEPNGEALWARVRTAVSDFLFNEWRSGACQWTADRPCE